MSELRGYGDKSKSFGLKIIKKAATVIHLCCSTLLTRDPSDRLLSQKEKKMGCAENVPKALGKYSA